VAWALQWLIGMSSAGCRTPAETGAADCRAPLPRTASKRAGEEFFRRVRNPGSAPDRPEISAVFSAHLRAGTCRASGCAARRARPSATPSLLTTAAYVIVTQGVAGLMFGVLWARTRSLTLLVLLHGMFDTPSNLARFMDVWGF
jgi:hypothetical protein